MKTVGSLSLVCYGSLSVIGLTWMAHDGDVWARLICSEHFGGYRLSRTHSLLASTFLGALVFLFSLVATQCAGWLSMSVRKLEQDMIGLLRFEVLSSAKTRAILVGTSAIGEEIFFRGAMQPALGWTLTTVAFGALHGFGLPRFWCWTLMATLMGGILGWLAIFTGGLLAPIVSHGLINWASLSLMTRSRSAWGPEKTLSPTHVRRYSDCEIGVKVII